MIPTAMQRRRLLFLLYIIVMLWLLFDRNRFIEGIPYMEQIQNNLNLRPFATIHLYTRLLGHPRRVLVRLAVMNLFGNVGMFLPLGYFLPGCLPALARFWRTVLCSAVIMSAVEVLQLLFLVGTCDIDDVLLNVVGAGLGYGFFALRQRCGKK